MAHKLFIIYLAGLAGIFKAIPVGILLQAPPVWVASMTALGGLTAAAILYVIGEWVRRMLEKRMSERRLERKKKNTHRLLSKYGIIGLGIFGTLLLGLHMTIILGLFFVKAKRRLLLWTIAGILLWSSVVTVTADSFELFERFPFLK